MGSLQLWAWGRPLCPSHGNGRAQWHQGCSSHQLSTILPREALGVVLHKDSKWYQQWKDFKDNNVVFNRECSRPVSFWLGDGSGHWAVHPL